MAIESIYNLKSAPACVDYKLQRNIILHACIYKQVRQLFAVWINAIIVTVVMHAVEGVVRHLRN